MSIVFRASMPFIVHQAKVQLRRAIALIGQFAIDTHGGSVIAFVIGGFGFFKRLLLRSSLIGLLLNRHAYQSVLEKTN